MPMACATVDFLIERTSPGGKMAEILKLDNGSLEYILEYTARLILGGKVVAFPTDTFYGLGADPFNLSAVNEIFRIKGRNSDRPIPLLVDSIDRAADLTERPPKLFFTLAEKFWPGALTLVVPASRQIPLKITANTGKVGLRCPLAPFVVSLITAAGRPLTGTSANLSDNESCSTADEVDCQIGDRLPLILDGGLTRGGLASTVVDLTGEKPRITRQGPISESELKEYLG